jgi:soluble lytic murein transglycosylase-like protein
LGIWLTDSPTPIGAVRHLPFALLVSLAVAAPAQAQIYSWRDANGTQVVSDRPRLDRGEMKTFAVGTSASVRATKPPAVPEAKGRYDDIIERHAATSGISPDLIKAVIQVESGFNPAAISPKGAQGLMQLMPATARQLGVSDPFHPEQNIRGGVAYLKQLLGQFGQDVRLALAAYNAGPGSVDRYGDVPPYRETQAYVKKITSATRLERPMAPQPSAPVIYKWLDIVEGRPVARYSNTPPTDRAYDIVGRR